MSIEYYDAESSSSSSRQTAASASLQNGDSSSTKSLLNGSSSSNVVGNPNKRYLECPGSLRVQHLKKFISKKYGLNEDFLVRTMIYSCLWGL